MLDWWEALGRPFTRLPRGAAAALLAALMAVLAWSVAATGTLDRLERVRTASAAFVQTAETPKDGTGDLALYARISARVAAGEAYHAAAMDEQRRSNYPTRPFVAVRQPTLAWLHALIGVDGVRYAQMALVLACLWAFDRRLKDVVTFPERAAALTLLAAGGAAVAVPTAGLIHELLGGLLLTLALALYRPERWWPSLLAAGLALAVRELALPFVLLWLAFALAGRRWREAGGVAALLAVFALGMGLHYLAVEAGRLPSDPASQGWTGLAGYGLPLMALTRLTGLLLLPKALAAPLAILPLIGWLGLGGRLGLFAALWFAGFFTMTALFARPENFYWVQLTLPAYGIGLAFAPRALAELIGCAARRSIARQN